MTLKTWKVCANRAGKEERADLLVGGAGLLMTSNAERSRVLTIEWRCLCAGKRCIHPNQVDIANQEFVPSAEQIRKAMKYVLAFQKSQGGVVAVGSKMVDAPVVKRAQDIIQLAIMSKLIGPNWMEEAPKGLK